MRGILICGGGRYLLSALVNIGILRGHGCELPVELWVFRGERLLKAAAKSLLPDGVTVRVLPELPTGYASKPYALVHSRFEEVISLDADNTPIRNPEYLFETEAYRETGALFWPDFFLAPPNTAWQELAQCDPVETLQQESGQMVIDRKRHRDCLETVLKMNERYWEIHSLLWGACGDKDTFQLSWYRHRSCFRMVPFFPGSCGYMENGNYRSNSMVQHDCGGEPLFLHKNGSKWHPLRASERRYWERYLFSKDPAGKEIEVELSHGLGNHFHTFKPLESIRWEPVPGAIRDLETVCLERIQRIRRKPWYAITMWPFMLRRRLRERWKRLTTGR